MADYSLRTTPTFVDGALLAANAVPDSLLVFIGGACAYEHVFQTLGQHDQTQTFITPQDRNRLLVTFTNSAAVAMGSETRTEYLVARAIKKRRPAAIILAQLSMITIAGEDLRQTARHLSRKHGLPVIPAVSPFLARDFSAAYESVLSGLAEVLPGGRGRRGRAPRVGLAGLLCERGEGDGEGNVAELTGLVEGLGLECARPWFSNSPYASLAGLGRATHIIALPYGRQAAAAVREKSRARVLELDLPVGLGGTSRWLKKVAAATGREKQAAVLIKRRLAWTVPRLDRAVSRRLAGKRAAVFLTRDWFEVLPRFFEEELGIETPVRVLRSRFPLEGARPAGDEPGLDRAFDPSAKSVNHQLAKAAAAGPIDFIVGSSWERAVLRPEFSGLPFFEFGYPSRQTHYLQPTPFLGLAGVLTWAQKLSDLLA